MRERIENDDLIFDQAIVRHGYADHMRDYDVLVEPYTSGGGPGLPIRPVGRFRYRFTHCPAVAVMTRLADETWQASWSDAFLDHEAYRQAGEPEGFLWAVEHADAYPGLKYVENADRARMWSDRMKREMHEVILETNVYSLHSCSTIWSSRSWLGTTLTASASWTTPARGSTRSAERRFRLDPVVCADARETRPRDERRASRYEPLTFASPA